MIHPYVFYALALLIVGSALLVVSTGNVFHAGLFLILTFLGVAGIYVSLHNYFLAAAQLLVYSGAIAVLMLFGIMMTQRLLYQKESSHNALWLVCIPFVLGLLAYLVKGFLSLPEGQFFPMSEDLLRAIGNSLLQAYVLPFEIISIVLLVALVGALAIAKDKEEA